jgi:hypothetical protein
MVKELNLVLNLRMRANGSREVGGDDGATDDRNRGRVVNGGRLN